MPQANVESRSTIISALSVAQAGTPTPGLLRMRSRWIWLRNDGANPLRIYFTQTDYDADTKFIVLAVGAAPLEGPFDIAGVWFRGVGGATSASGLIAHAS